MSKRELPTLISEWESLGLPVNQILDFIRFMYIAREAPYIVDTGVKEPYKVLGVRDEVLETLKVYSLIDLTRHRGITWILISELGFDMGQQIYHNVLVEKQEEVKKVLEKYPRELIRVCVLGCLEHPAKKESRLEVVVGGFDLETAYDRSEIDIRNSFISDDETISALKEGRYKKGGRSPLVKLLEEAAKRYTYESYERLMATFLARYKGRVHERIINLMRELEGLGLVANIPIYSTSGQYAFNVYVAPPELLRELEKHSLKENLDHALREFFFADIILRSLNRPINKATLLALMSIAGSTLGEVKLALELTYREGITSRFNESGDPDSPAFLVFDKERALEKARLIVENIEKVILGEYR